MKSVNCSRARSLVLDGVGDAEAVRDARAHVLGCPDCASDLEPDHVGAGPLDRLREQPTVLRLLLLVLSMVQLTFAIPWVFGVSPFWDGTGRADPAHLTRDGTIGLVVGLAGLLTARQPRLAYFFLTVGWSLALLQVVAFVSDLRSEGVTAGFETVHALTLAVTALMTAMAFPMRRGRRPGRGPLRAV